MSITFSQRKPKTDRKCLVRFWVEKQLYNKFTEKVFSQDLLIKDVFTDFMKWFLEQPRIKKK